MANQGIDGLQEILNKLDNELIVLDRVMFEAKGSIAILKFISSTLRDEQGAFTKH